MNDERDEASDKDEALTGGAARRKFLKNSGGLAIAAPAAVLLLSAGSKSAHAIDPYQTKPMPPTPKGSKNLLDP